MVACDIADPVVMLERGAGPSRSIQTPDRSTRTARVLLTVIDHNPESVVRALAAKRQDSGTRAALFRSPETAVRCGGIPQ